MDDLVEAAREGDRVAFDEIVRRTHREVYTLALRLMGDQEDASDVVQDVYVRAFKGLRRFRGDASISTWLYRITANCSATSMRRRARHRHLRLDPELTVVDGRPESDPELGAVGSLARRDVEAAVAELPARLRAVVVLRDVHDFNHKEIAEQLGISESAAKVRLHRARKRLRVVLDVSDAQVSPDGAPTTEVAADDRGSVRAG